jgi:hypothetical protein
MPGIAEKLLVECLRAKTTRTKTPVLALNFRVPMTSLCPYLNPISQRNRDVWRLPNGHISTPTVMMTSWWCHLKKLQVEVWDGSQSIFDTGKPHFAKLVIINHHLVKILPGISVTWTSMSVLVVNGSLDLVHSMILYRFLYMVYRHLSKHVALLTGHSSSRCIDHFQQPG